MGRHIVFLYRTIIILLFLLTFPRFIARMIQVENTLNGRSFLIAGSESVRSVRAHVGAGGWSPGSGPSEPSVGRYGEARYSFLSARKGIQVVPRKAFALSRFDSGFLFFPSSGCNLLIRSVNNGMRITQGLRTSKCRIPDLWDVAGWRLHPRRGG